MDPPAASSLSATTAEVTTKETATVVVPVAEAAVAKAAAAEAAAVEVVTGADNVVDESSTTVSKPAAADEVPAKVNDSPSADATPAPEAEAAAAATVASDAAATESIAETPADAETPTNGPSSAAEATTTNEKHTSQAPEINSVDSSDKSEDGVPTPPDVVEVVSSDLSSDSSSEVPPAQQSTTQAAPKPTAAAAASSVVIEVTDSDSLDDDIDNMIVTETVGEDEPPQDDELMREMEEIEGTLDSAKTAAVVENSTGAVAEVPTKPAADDESPASSAEATATPSKAAADADTATAEQETSDLLKDLESGGDSAESNSSAAAVDSTSEEKTLKRPHSAVDSAESSEAAVPETDAKKPATSAEVAAAADAPMEVDDEIEETIATAVSSDKDEGISSTSAEVSSVTGAASQVDNSAVSSTDGAAPDAAQPQSDSSAGNAEAEAATDDLDASVANATAAASVSAASESAADRSLITPVPSSAAGSASLASDNKLLSNLMLNNGNSSTPNSNPVSAAATPNVFNSTPIQRQFEISSENVSKIDGAIDSQNTSTTAGTLTTSTSSASSPSAAAAEPQSSSDNLTHYAKVLKQFNGLGGDLTIARASTTTTSTTASSAAGAPAADAKVAAAQQQQQQSEEASHNGSGDDTTSSSSTTANQQTSDSESFSYDVSIWYEQSELVYLQVERKSANSSSATTGGASTTTATTDSTTNGSVTSVGPFTLPGQTAAAAVAAANSAQHSSIASSSSLGGGGGSGDSTRLASATLPSQVPRIRQTVSGGSVGLANFMIEHFTALKRELGVVDEVAPATTPAAASRAGKAAQKKAAAAAVKAAAAASPDVSAASTSRRNKRAAVEVDADVAEPAAKKAKSTPSVEIAVALAAAESRISVLARWADKKYYAGRLKESKPNHKYVVIFEDGATKTLVQEHIVFGNDSGVLPLLNQYVHARIDGDEDTYEPGLVTEINSTAGDTILYTVVAESQTVTVTSSDLYLEEDQARLIQQSTEANVPQPDGSGAAAGSADAAAAALRSPGTPTVGSKRSSRPTAKFGEAASPRSRTSTGGKTAAAADGAEPSTSAAAAATASAAGTRQTGRRNKSKATAAAEFEAAAFAAHPMIRSFSDSSELSDTLDSIEMETAQVSQAETSALEEVDGVQPELQKTARESELCKLSFQHEYLGNGDRTRSMDELLGPIPAADQSQLFHNKFFMLTCTIPAAKKLQQNGVGTVASAAAQAPFFKDHLRRQIEAGGGVVYEHFEDVPKGKYRNVRLVAAQPCATAKYVQCLAANIKVVSHKYIIESCRQRTLLDYRRYLLPAGWSLLRDRLIRYQTGRAADQRHSANPLSGTHILIASDNRDFEAFWRRVCTLASATVKLVATPADITAASRGYMLTDKDFSAEVKVKAEHFKVAVVSTVWLVECLVAGELCAPDANEKFRKAYQDEYF